MKSIWTAVILCASPLLAQPWTTAYYVQAQRVLPIDDIPWENYTHVVHYGIQPSSLNPGSIDAAALSIEVNADAFVAAAHRRGVKALIGVKDRDSDYSAFSEATSPARIDGFVAQITDFVTRHQYDGVDLDWEVGISTPQYVDLIRRLRAALPWKTITMAVNVGELKNVVRQAGVYLDRISVMCYDLDATDINGNALKTIWFNMATLRGASRSNWGCDFCAREFAGTGMPASKIGLAIPFYGRVLTGGCVDAACTEAAVRPGQDFSRPPSRRTVEYRRLVTNPFYFRPESIGWDETHQSSYILILDDVPANNIFISYTDARQIEAIVDLMYARGYGGIATYELSYEFLPGESGPGRYPLSTALSAAIAARESQSNPK